MTCRWNLLLATLMIALGGFAAELHAGPWARGAETWFVSPEFGIDRTKGAMQTRFQLYVERGISDRFTLGGKLVRSGVAPSEPDGRAGSRAEAEMFVRWHPGSPGAAVPLALDLGLDVRQGPDGNADARVKVGAHAGRGFALGELEGWSRLSVDATRGKSAESSSLSAMVQAGVRPTENTVFWVSGTLGRYGADTGSRITVSGGYRFSAATTATLGLTRFSGNTRETGLRLGLWHEF